jgi:hypothetical protein
MHTRTATEAVGSAIMDIERSMRLVWPCRCPRTAIWRILHRIWLAVRSRVSGGRRGLRGRHGARERLLDGFCVRTWLAVVHGPLCSLMSFRPVGHLNLPAICAAAPPGARAGGQGLRARPNQRAGWDWGGRARVRSWIAPSARGLAAWLAGAGSLASARTRRSPMSCLGDRSYPAITGGRQALISSVVQYVSHAGAREMRRGLAGC